MTNEEFQRQRAASLNNVKKTEEKEDYQTNRSTINRRLDNKTKYRYLDLISKYKIVLYLSLPICFVMALSATICLVMMGLIKSSFILWVVTILMFILLYSTVVSLVIYKGIVKREEKKDEYEKLKKKIREEYLRELESEYTLIRK